MRSGIYRLYISRLIWFLTPCVSYLTDESRCISRNLQMSSNFEESHLYPCGYLLIHLFSDDFLTSLNTNPDPFIHLLLLLHQANLSGRGIGGTATISTKHLVNCSPLLHARRTNSIKWCLSLNVAGVQIICASTFYSALSLGRTGESTKVNLAGQLWKSLLFQGTARTICHK